MAAVKDTDKGAKALVARVQKAAGPLVLTVGVHGEEGGAATQDGKTTVGDVATANEFGLGVPERSFIRAWADEQEAENQAALRKIGEAVTKGTLPSAEVGLERLGLKMVGEIQARIAGGIDPPNAPATIARKGSSTPLINYGQLRSSVRHKVTREG
jgi:hypothetical protein